MLDDSLDAERESIVEETVRRFERELHAVSAMVRRALPDYVPPCLERELRGYLQVAPLLGSIDMPNWRCCLAL